MKVKKQHIRKAVFTILSAWLVFILTGAFLQRHALACEFLPVMGYQELEGKVFLSPDIPSDRVRELSQLVDSARQRLAGVYGAPVAKPWILIASDAGTARKWGGNETGAMHRMPWCSCIVLGSLGQNVDVMAHELLHAEMQHRTGLWRFLREIPVWFDEGAALTLDYREPFLPENIHLPDEKITGVQLLGRHKDFFSGEIKKNYQAARMAVVPLIVEKRFYDDLERIKNGESFQDVFLNPLTKMQPSANSKNLK